MPLNLRNQGAKALTEVLAGRSLSAVLPKYLDRVKDADKALLQQFCYGSLHHYEFLDWAVDNLLLKPLRRKEDEIKQLLILGLYQILLSKVPTHAALYETVEAAVNLKKPWAKGLVNAVLRQGLRQKKNLLDQPPATPEARYNSPQWLLANLQRSWPNHWQEICENSLYKAPMTLRVNLSQISRIDYLKTLESQGLEGMLCQHSPAGIRLLQPTDVTNLPGFAQGQVSVQDEGAQLAGFLLDAQPGETLLDACAAPGGKSCHILELCNNQADLWALDSDATRLKRIKENFARQGLQGKILCADAADTTSWSQSKTFDRILLDAPCSATGVIRRHPDIKRLRRGSDIKKLAHLQSQLLEALWGVLRPEGTMLYATCSVLAEENTEQIRQFLQKNKDAQLVKTELKWGFDTEFGQQLLPKIDAWDGFFYAKLKKKAKVL